jgi:hypothetical protein
MSKPSADLMARVQRAMSGEQKEILAAEIVDVQARDARDRSGARVADSW